MEFRQLEYFIAVAEELSFARAAARLHISQPAVSRQVRLLESELDTALLDPTQKLKHKRVVLTEEGSYFYQEAVKVLRQSKELAEGLERLRSRRKTVNVGYGAGIPKEGLVAVLDFLGRKLPDFDLRLKVYPSAFALEEALRKNEIHFGTALDTGHVAGGLEGIPLLEGHVQVCISARHALSCKAALSMTELKNEKWIASPLPAGPPGSRLGETVPDFGQLLALAELNRGVGPVPSFYRLGGPDLRQADLLVDKKSIPCKQSLLFKKDNPSFLVRKVLISC